MRRRNDFDHDYGYLQVIRRVGIINYLGYNRRIGAEIERLSYINLKWTPVKISLSIV
jgi:hypothetical protein